MLSLSRKVNQQIVIDGGRIVITLLKATGNGKARIGIEASPDIDIKRAEKYEGEYVSIMKGNNGQQQPLAA